MRTKQPKGALSFGGSTMEDARAGQAPGDPALLLARDGGGGAPDVPGREARHRARDRRRLLLRLRPAPDREHGGPCGDREADARHRRRRPRLHPRRAEPGGGAHAVQGPALQAGAHRGAARGRGDLHLHAGHLHRSLPRPARRHTRELAAGRLQAHLRSRGRTGAGTRRTRCSSASTAPRGNPRRTSRRT